MISLSHIIRIAAPETYKLHLACWNGKNQPLDVFVRDRKEWDGWNAWRGERDDFSRNYIFSLIDYYHERDHWLFGGIYQVLARSSKQGANSYHILLADESKPFIGRLKLSLKRPGRGRAFKFENHYNSLCVREILAEPYSGEAFCGHDQIDIKFAALEAIVKLQKADWKSALENAKGVYLITDTSNGKRYVGSAYGTTGLWSRWSCYVGTGHGYNDELTALIDAYGIDYARRHFHFALLEHRTMKTDDDVVIAREQYWKRVLLTREYGYNRN